MTDTLCGLDQTTNQSKRNSDQTRTYLDESMNLAQCMDLHAAQKIIGVVYVVEKRILELTRINNLAHINNLLRQLHGAWRQRENLPLGMGGEAVWL